MNLFLSVLLFALPTWTVASDAIESFRSHDKYGFQQDNRIKIAPRFAQAEDFSEGLGAATEDGEHWGYVNIKGEWAVKPMFNIASNFHEGRAAVRLADEQWMYIRNDGVPLQHRPFSLANDFSEGVASVEKSGKAFYIDLNGKELAWPKFDKASNFHDGKALVISDGKGSILFRDGSLNAIGPIEAFKDFSDGIAPIKRGERWCFIRDDGVLVSGPKYEEAKGFSGGHAVVKFGGWGVIDTQGAWRLPPRFDRCYASSDGDYSGSIADATVWIDDDGVAKWYDYRAFPWKSLGLTEMFILSVFLLFRVRAYWFLRKSIPLEHDDKVKKFYKFRSGQLLSLVSIAVLTQALSEKYLLSKPLWNWIRSYVVLSFPQSDSFWYWVHVPLNVLYHVVIVIILHLSLLAMALGNFSVDKAYRGLQIGASTYLVEQSRWFFVMSGFIYVFIIAQGFLTGSWQNQMLVYGCTLGVFALYYSPWARFFIRATPLKDGRLKRAIDALAAKGGAPKVPVYVYGDAGLKSPNAFTTGAGKRGAVFLSRTLLDDFSQSQVVAVAGHELGHLKRGHFLKRLLWIGGIQLVFVVAGRAFGFDQNWKIWGGLNLVVMGLVFFFFFAKAAGKSRRPTNGARGSMDPAGIWRQGLNNSTVSVWYRGSGWAGRGISQRIHPWMNVLVILGELKRRYDKAPKNIDFWGRSRLGNTNYADFHRRNRASSLKLWTFSKMAQIRAFETAALDDIKVEDFTPEELAEWEKAQKKFRARMRGMTIFCLILALPIAIGAYLVWQMRTGMAADRTWAEAELKKAEPSPKAYGVLGSSLLNEGKIAEALPLLKRASEIETRAANASSAHLIYVEAQLEGMKKNIPGASREQALATLAELKAYAPGLPQGQAAAAWHGIGKLSMYLGLKDEALASLKKAVELQPDDWVDEGGGRRYKHRGIASIYQKDYSGALYQ